MLAVDRAFAALGPMWTEGDDSSLQRPILHHFEAKWAVHETNGPYIGWTANVGEMFSRATRYEPAAVCNACFLYQHDACELPNSCTCTTCHPRLFTAEASTPAPPALPQGTPAGVLTPAANTVLQQRGISTSGEAREPA